MPAASWNRAEAESLGLLSVCPVLLPLLPDMVSMETRVPQQFFFVEICLCYPDRLLRRCCHPTGRGREPLPRRRSRPSAAVVAMETARGKSEGRLHALAEHGGTMAQLGCCSRILTPASPVQSHSPSLYFGQKANVCVAVICRRVEPYPVHKALLSALCTCPSVV